ncbi:SLF2 protein, partial [Atlantisia rogersi]|nr:SLF2 protein [Atlantisia rogersi]
TPATMARETDQGLRNQAITEFFKPVLKQDHVHKDRAVLGSPSKGNLKDVSVLHAEHFEKKLSSPKKVRRKKLSDQKPNKSLVVDAFQRGIEKKDRVDFLENGRACRALGSLYPKIVIKKLKI